MPRPKGSLNKITLETKDFIKEIITNEEPRIASALEELYSTNKPHYMQAIIKLLPFVTPKVSEVNLKPSEVVLKAPSWFNTEDES